MQTPTKPFGSHAALARGAYLLAVLVGSYGVIWVFTGCTGVALFRLGLERSEAVIFATLLGVLLYPAVAIAALTVRRPLRFWAVLATVSGVLATLNLNWAAN